MPTGIGRGRENPRRVACQSNLKQMALAVAQYKDDNEKFPPATNSASDFAQADNWAGRIFPYVKSARVFQCPSDENATDEQKTSYGYNVRLDAHESKIKNANSVILHYEVRADANNWTQSGSAPASVSAKMRHLDGANYSFADGHVKWLKPAQITAEKPNGKNYTFRIQ
jgi:prepilin-type processing-associated H-X9-DG protein